MIALAVMVITITGVSSCSSAPTNERVGGIVEKHDKGETLSEGDYSVLIEYMGNRVKELIQIEKQHDDGELDWKEYQEKDTEVSEKYPYGYEVQEILSDNYDDLGKSNYDKIEKIENETGTEFNKGYGTFVTW